MAVANARRRSGVGNRDPRLAAMTLGKIVEEVRAAAIPEPQGTVASEEGAPER